jgi:DNA-binding CsgD family transcriptional regulator
LAKQYNLEIIFPQIAYQKEIFENTLSSLPEDQQRVLKLLYEKEIPVREIALQMNCSVSTVYNKVHRALFKLKTVLNPGVFENAYSILYPETGKPTTIVSSNVSECDPANNQSIV